MSNPKQGIALGEAARATSVANISQTMDEKQKTMERLQMPKGME